MRANVAHLLVDKVDIVDIVPVATSVVLHNACCKS